MEGRQTSDIDFGYRRREMFQPGPQVKRHVSQWTEKGTDPFTFH